WYDLAEDGVNISGNRSFLPSSINSITLDPQGRLLFGTVNGIWRGVPFGFGYDYTTGGTSRFAQGVGVLAEGPNGVAPPDLPTNPMRFTSLNGNLQIAALTSVAIDPVSFNTYYTTQLYSGSAMTTSAQPDSWTTMDATGPTIPGLNNSTVNLGIPNAVQIR